MNNCFHLYGCQFRMVWGSLTRFSWDGCARNVNTFQYFFGLFNCFFFWLLQGEILIPASSLLFVLGPTNTHPHALQAAFCSSFPGTGEKETALKGRILSSLGRAVFSLLLRVACRCSEFCRFLFSPSSFSFKSVSPWPLWRVHLLVLYFLCSRPGALEKFPFGFLSPRDA